LLVLIALACAACGGGTRAVNPADVHMQVTVDPTPPVSGQPATVDVTLRTSSGAPVSGAKLLVIQAVSAFNSPSGGMQPVTTNATEHGAGDYTAGGVLFPSQDTWVITVSGQLPGGGSIEGTFDTPGTASAGQGASVWQPVTNPVPMSADAVSAGKAIFLSDCSACHGQTGQGNGPAARALIPPPSDLAVHVPMHPAGMLWYWISNGISRTAMPAWKGTMSTTQRWELLDYLESAFPQPAATQASASSTPALVATGGLTIQLTTSPLQPTLGPAQLQITLKQANGGPVSDAHLSVRGTMTGMSMAPVTATLRGEGSGRYIFGSFPFSMTGSWQLQVTAKLRSGSQVQHTFAVQVK
jgi:mono/diheme cytochrome c family protein